MKTFLEESLRVDSLCERLKFSLYEIGINYAEQRVYILYKRKVSELRASLHSRAETSM